MSPSSQMTDVNSETLALTLIFWISKLQIPHSWYIFLGYVNPMISQCQDLILLLLAYAFPVHVTFACIWSYSSRASFISLSLRVPGMPF